MMFTNKNRVGIMDPRRWLVIMSIGLIGGLFSALPSAILMLIIYWMSKKDVNLVTRDYYRTHEVKDVILFGEQVEQAKVVFNCMKWMAYSYMAGVLVSLVMNVIFMLFGRDIEMRNSVNASFAIYFALNALLTFSETFTDKTDKLEFKDKTFKGTLAVVGVTLTITLMFAYPILKGVISFITKWPMNQNIPQAGNIVLNVMVVVFVTGVLGFILWSFFMVDVIKSVLHLYNFAIRFRPNTSLVISTKNGIQKFKFGECYPIVKEGRVYVYGETGNRCLAEGVLVEIEDNSLKTKSA